MATAVQIQVTVDESGVVQGVKAVSSSLEGLKEPTQRFGNDSNRVFTETHKRAREASQAIMQMGNMIGVQVPSAVGKLLTKLPGVAAASTAAFGVAAGLGFIAMLANVGNHWDDIKAKATEYFRSVWDGLYRLATGIKTDHAQMLEDLQTWRDLSSAIDATISARAKANSAAKEGYAAMRAELDNTLVSLNRFREVQEDAIRQRHERGTPLYLDQLSKLDLQISAQKKAAIEAYSKSVADLNRKASEAEAQRMFDIQKANAGSDFEGVLIQRQADLAGVAAVARSGIGNAGQLRIDAEAKADATMLKMRRDFTDQMSQVTREAGAQQADGFLRVALDTQNKVAQLQDAFKKKWGESFMPDESDPYFQDKMDAWVNASADLQRAITATEKAGIEERQKLQRENTETTIQLETRAAEATLPPWQRAAAGIRDSYQQALRQISQDLNDHRITEEDALRRRNAAWQEMNGQLADDWRAKTDEMAGELESLFSGNILENIKNRFKHLFFEIAAQAVLSFSGVQQAIYGGIPSGGVGASGSGGGGGLFGGILGGLLGRWGSGGGGGGGWVTTPPFNPNAGTGFDLGSLSGMTGSLYGGGLNDNVTGNVGALTMNPMVAGLSAGMGTGVMAQSQSNRAAVANTLSGSVLQSVMGKVFTHGISIGKFSLSGSQLGSLGVGLGLTSIMGAYSSGSKLLGGIGGGVGGLMTALAAGAGPVGLAVGAAIGGLAGLFSGIFGGKKRHDQAVQLSNQVIDQITQAQTAYMSHQTDYTSAIQALEQLRQQASQPFWQLGKQGKDVWWKSVYWRIDDAEKQINDVEMIRQQRSSINFAPTQFHDGGLIGPSDGLRLPNGDVLIRAKVGETVMNEAATQKYGSKLDAMNSGAGSSGGDTYIINAVDAKSFYAMLRDGGIRVVKQAWAADSTEYAGGGL